MSEQFLHGANIRATLKHVGCERAAQGVGVNALNACSLCNTLEDSIYRPRGIRSRRQDVKVGNLGSDSVELRSRRTFRDVGDPSKCDVVLHSAFVVVTLPRARHYCQRALTTFGASNSKPVLDG